MAHSFSNLPKGNGLEDYIFNPFTHVSITAGCRLFTLSRVRAEGPFRQQLSSLLTSYLDRLPIRSCHAKHNRQGKRGMFV
jgi:hypothetical protein